MLGVIVRSRVGVARRNVAQHSQFAVDYMSAPHSGHGRGVVMAGGSRDPSKARTKLDPSGGQASIIHIS